MMDGHYLFIDFRAAEKVKGRGAGSVVPQSMVTTIVELTLRLHSKAGTDNRQLQAARDIWISENAKNSKKCPFECVCSRLFAALLQNGPSRYNGEVAVRTDGRSVAYAVNQSVKAILVEKSVVESSDALLCAIALKNNDFFQSKGSRESNKGRGKGFKAVESLGLGHLLVEATVNTANKLALQPLLWLFPPPHHSHYDSVHIHCTSYCE